MADEPIDKSALYGRYQRPSDARAQIDTDRLKWQNKLSQQLAHKALDEPIDEPDGMNVNVRRGLGWPEMSVIGVVVIGMAYMFHQNTSTVIEREHVRETQQVPDNYHPPVHVPQQRTPIERTPQQTDVPQHQHTDRDTLMVPRLRFGPQR